VSHPTSTASTDAPLDAAKVRSALPFFRVMALVVGVGLLLLVTEVVLKYGFDNPVLAWWQAPHGFLYMVYLAACANLGFAARWPLSKMVLIMLAGCVPLLSFWVEHKTSAEVTAQLQAQAAA
jgi:integral membrane protein